MALESSHTAASRTDPAFRTWNPYPDSADAALIPELTTIMSRTRDLARNNGLAAGALQTYRDNIIGHVLRLSAQPDYKLLNWTKEQAQEWGNNAEAEFRSWAEEPIECDAAQSMTFLGLTLLALSSSFLNGEALAIPYFIKRPFCRWQTRIGLIESDRLKTPPWLAADPTVRGGIKIDDLGAPMGYWILRYHPGDTYRFGAYKPEDFVYVPARTPWGRQRVIHLHDKERTGQSRGKPALTAVLRQFYLGGRYSAAELDAAVTSSMILGFMEAQLTAEDAASAFHSGGNEATQFYDDQVQQYRPVLQSNTVIPIPPGSTFTPNTPKRPNPAFEQFMQATFRHAAAGLHIPYELLMKDFSGTNYSSARASLLEAWRFFLGRRRWMSDYWLRPIYKLWLEEAVNVGRVQAPDYYQNQYAYSRSRWVFAGRGWVDPVKEATASKIRMDSNLSTLEAECAEQGLDYEEVIDQRSREMALLKERGLWVDPAPSASTPGAAGAEAADPADAADAGEDPVEEDDTGDGGDSQPAEALHAVDPMAEMVAAVVALAEKPAAPIHVSVQMPQPAAPSRIETERDADGNLVARVYSTQKTITTRRDDDGNLSAEIQEGDL
jgi:lambda family phage portal protein